MDLSRVVIPVYPVSSLFWTSRLFWVNDAAFGLGGQAAEEAIARMVEAEDTMEGARSEAKRLRSHLTTAESKLKVRSQPGTCSELGTCLAAPAQPHTLASGARPS